MYRTVSVRAELRMNLDRACVVPSGRAWDQTGQPDQREEQDPSDPCPQGRRPREAQVENRAYGLPSGVGGPERSRF